MNDFKAAFLAVGLFIAGLIGLIAIALVYKIIWEIAVR